MSDADYNIKYVTPLIANGFLVEVIRGDYEGSKYTVTKGYSVEDFKKHFYGTMTQFFRDETEIKNPDEIMKYFDVHYAYAISLNLYDGSMQGSDGVKYSIKDNMFCKHNPATAKLLLQHLNNVQSCYIQMIVDNKTNKIIDITLIENPSDPHKFSYRHRLEKGFNTVTDILSDRDLKQSEIAKLIVSIKENMI